MFCKCIHTAWLLIIVICTTNALDPKVKTKLGQIIGTNVKLSANGVEYEVNQYLGIHYAKPPVGDLRFRKPEPYGEFDSPFDASNYGYVCPQIYNHMEPFVGTEDEDCLHLNVFVPVGQHPDQASGHAVMVWIYGGVFILGSSDEIDPKALTAVGNVIIVTFNYRLGPLGFLSTMDSNLVSNLGLWDQHLALKWVQDNIESFGGDKNRITIFGESSGAASSVIHGMYEGSPGLFHRIIASSGSPSMKPLNCSRNARRQVMAIADRLGCSADDTSKVLACLQTKPWKDYMAEVNKMAANMENFENAFFDPVVDGNFIKYDPRDVSKLAKTLGIKELEIFRSFDFLGGMVAYEGACYVPYFIGDTDPEQFHPTSVDMKSLILAVIGMVYNRELPDEVMKMVEYEYTDWSNPTNFHNIRMQFVRMFGDTGVAVPVVEYSRLHAVSNTSSSYMYKFIPSPTTRRSSTPSWTPGADHGDDRNFIFGVEQLPDVTAWEIDLSRRMMYYWTNFAKSGNPNIPVRMSPEWLQYELDTQYFMALDKVMGNDSVKQYLYAREHTFWQEIFPDMVSSLDKLSYEISPEHAHVHEDL